MGVKPEKISPAKAQRRKALPRFETVFFEPLRLCGREFLSQSDTDQERGYSWLSRRIFGVAGLRESPTQSLRH
ncbi:MAG TPA: hypothetical protein VKA97_08755, partial [Pyrinomonadaceae bacterium]|nr:hypothetical protein [Pyrinomonadaceae bacterium]